MDFELERKPRLRLSRRAVYHPGTWGRNSEVDARADQVTLHDVFPTFNEMMKKFIWSRATVGPNAKLPERVADWFHRRYNTGALNSGFTNALNHDETPLLQSYVRVELTRVADTWQLRLLPYMERERSMQRQPDRQLELPARHAKPAKIENTLSEIGAL